MRRSASRASGSLDLANWKRSVRAAARVPGSGESSMPRALSREAFPSCPALAAAADSASSWRASSGLPRRRRRSAAMAATSGSLRPEIPILLRNWSARSRRPARMAVRR